jgi:hypothetical protein
MALIVRASRKEPCSLLRVGVPVTVAALVTPSTLGEHFHEGAEGPVWMLAEPLRCPHGRSNCPGIDRYPDACLRPFDPESEPEPAAEDVRSSAPVEA